MPGKAKAHAQKHGAKYGLAALLLSAGGVSQLERTKTLVCGDHQAAITAVAYGYSIAVSAQSERAQKAEAALEKCAGKLSRCRR